MDGCDLVLAMSVDPGFGDILVDSPPPGLQAGTQIIEPTVPATTAQTAE